MSRINVPQDLFHCNLPEISPFPGLAVCLECAPSDGEVNSIIPGRVRYPLARTSTASLDKVI
jgi:hypothetical protein